MMKKNFRRAGGRVLAHGCMAFFLAASALAAGQGAPRSAAAETRTRLPTGAWLDAAGRTFDVGNMPLAMLPSPDGRHLILSLSGWREQGVQVVELATGRVVQTL